MSGLTDDWDAVPVSAGAKTASASNTADWDAVPIAKQSQSEQSGRVTPGQSLAAKGADWWNEAKSGNWKALPIVGATEAAANTVSGVGSSIAGGLAGLGRTGYGLVTGQGVDKSLNAGADVSQAVQNAGTYQPRTAGGKLLTEAINVPMSAATTATTSMGGDVGQVLGNRDAGETIGGMVPAVVGTLAMGKQARNLLQPDAQTLDAPGAFGKQSVVAGQSSYSQMAAASGASPEIQAAIAKAEASGSLNEVAAQRHTEASSLPVQVDLTAGQATGDVNLLSHEQNIRGKFPQLAERINAQNGQLIGNINAIRDAAAPDNFAANHVENGQNLIDSYKAKDAALSSDITAKYQALKDANGGEFPLSGSDFATAADAALKKDNVTRFLPSEVAGILSDVREGGAMNFNDFENYRTILAQQARKADRAGDGTASHAIGLVRESLENIPMSKETAEIKPLADAARSAAKARFDMLRNDPAYKAAVNDTVAPDNFIQKYVVNGKVNDLKTMRSMLADDPSAAQTISAGTINYLKNRANVAGDTGNFSTAGYNKGLQAIGPKLNQLVEPAQAAQLQTLGNVARYTTEQPRGSYVNNSNTLVGTLAQGAKAFAGKALDKTTFGVSGLVGDALQNRAQAKAVNKSLAPGAGLTKVKDFP